MGDGEKEEREQVRTIATKRTESGKRIELMAVLILHNANEDKRTMGAMGEGGYGELAEGEARIANYTKGGLKVREKRTELTRRGMR